MPPRTEKIEQIRQFPALLEAAISNIELDLPCAEGEWTPRQVVHHLADSHINGYIRMKLILTEETPTIKPYQQESWAMLADVALPLEPSLSILRGLHTRWCVLMEAMAEEDWSRTGLHPVNGVMSMDDLLNLYIGHGVAHVGQIAKQKKASGE
jgi:hypothetical protein